MKKFKYRWKLGEQELVGKKDCFDELALKAHVQKHGGELLEILHKEDIAPDFPSFTLDEKHSKTFNFNPNISVRRRFLPLNESPAWLNLICGWGAIITGGVGILIGVLIVLCSFFIGLNWMGPYSLWIKIALITGAILVAGLHIAVGLVFLSHPMVASYFLFAFASFSIFWDLIAILSGHFSSLVSVIIPGFIIWLLFRKSNS